MLATRCACGFEALADEQVTDHLQAMFEPKDCVGTDGRMHLEEDAQACSCGFSTTSPTELDAHFLAIFTPGDSVGRDGKKHEAAGCG